MQFNKLAFSSFLCLSSSQEFRSACWNINGSTMDQQYMRGLESIILRGHRLARASVDTKSVTWWQVNQISLNTESANQKARCVSNWPIRGLHCYQGVTLRWSLNVIITKLGWESLEYFSRYRDTCHYRPQHHLTTLKIRWHAESAQDWICLESWNTQNLNI